MAQKVTVTLEDDLDGTAASETVRFGIDGASYEIDLSARNARRFRTHLAPFIAHARAAGRGRSRRPARSTASRQLSSDIRAWAKARGIAVSDRGRIPASVVSQYQASTTHDLSRPRGYSALNGFHRDMCARRTSPESGHGRSPWPPLP